MTEQTAVGTAGGRKVARQLTGRVVGDKMDRTVTVLIERRVTHPLYGKIVTRSKKYHAHDETNAYHEGEIARIVECAPKSKLKTWEVLPKDQAQNVSGASA